MSETPESSRFGRYSMQFAWALGDTVRRFLGRFQQDEENPDDWVKGDDPREISAVTKIQAAFRGHQVRKKKDEMATGEPSKAELEEEFRADDEELCNAATKIQATFRGHMSRKKPEEEISEKMEKLAPKAAEEEVDMDLTDPELHKAATKIQASFRGHKVRKEDTKPL